MSIVFLLYLFFPHLAGVTPLLWIISPSLFLKRLSHTCGLVERGYGCPGRSGLLFLSFEIWSCLFFLYTPFFGSPFTCSRPPCQTGFRPGPPISGPPMRVGSFRGPSPPLSNFFFLDLQSSLSEGMGPFLLSGLCPACPRGLLFPFKVMFHSEPLVHSIFLASRQLSYNAQPSFS